MTILRLTRNLYFGKIGARGIFLEMGSLVLLLTNEPIHFKEWAWTHVFFTEHGVCHRLSKREDVIEGMAIFGFHA